MAAQDLKPTSGVLTLLPQISKKLMELLYSMKDRIATSAGASFVPSARRKASLVRSCRREASLVSQLQEALPSRRALPCRCVP